MKSPGFTKGHLGTWASGGLGCAEGMVGLDGLKGHFQPQWFHDSTILPLLYAGCGWTITAGTSQEEIQGILPLPHIWAVTWGAPVPSLTPGSKESSHKTPKAHEVHTDLGPTMVPGLFFHGLYFPGWFGACRCLQAQFNLHYCCSNIALAIHVLGRGSCSEFRASKPRTALSLQRMEQLRRNQCWNVPKAKREISFSHCWPGVTKTENILISLLHVPRSLFRSDSRASFSLVSR